MTRWRSSRLLLLVSVLILHVNIQVSTAATTTVDPVSLIPIFSGVASSKTTQAIGGALGGGNGKGGWPDELDPNDFSPDDPKSPSGAAQNPEAGVSSTSTTSATTAAAAAANTTTTGTATSTTASATGNTNAASNTAPAPAPTSLVCSQGQVQVSVESAGVFCVRGPRICSGSMNDGNCPGPDERNGLPNGSYCGVVGSGVYGCKRNPTPTTA